MSYYYYIIIIMTIFKSPLVAHHAYRVARPAPYRHDLLSDLHHKTHTVVQCTYVHRYLPILIRVKP